MARRVKRELLHLQKTNEPEIIVIFPMYPARSGHNMLRVQQDRDRRDRGREPAGGQEAPARRITELEDRIERIEARGGHHPKSKSSRGEMVVIGTPSGARMNPGIPRLMFQPRSQSATS